MNTSHRLIVIFLLVLSSIPSIAADETAAYRTPRLTPYRMFTTLALGVLALGGVASESTYLESSSKNKPLTHRTLSRGGVFLRMSQSLGSQRDSVVEIAPLETRVLESEGPLGNYIDISPELTSLLADIVNGLKTRDELFKSYPDDLLWGDLARITTGSSDPALMTAHGVCHFHGKGVAEKNEQIAVDLFTQAAQQGFANAQTRLGNCYQFGQGVAKNHQIAAELFWQAAEQDHPAALHALGTSYLYGMGPQRDETQAFELFSQAAKQGFTGAIYSLGHCYFFGEGVAQDKQKGVELFHQAAQQGHAVAAYMFAQSCRHGQGIAKDEHLAAQFYQQAGEQGHTEALYQLSTLFRDGKGVVKDPHRQIELLRQAAAQGHALAKKALVKHDEL